METFMMNSGSGRYEGRPIKRDDHKRHTKMMHKDSGRYEERPIRRYDDNRGTRMMHQDNGRHENVRPIRRYRRERIYIKHPRIICDSCDQKIDRGIRYKCTICEDFDLCDMCESNEYIRSRHFDDEHVFLKIRDSTEQSF